MVSDYPFNFKLRGQSCSLMDYFCYRQKIPLLISLNVKTITCVSTVITKEYCKWLENEDSDKAQTVFRRSLQREKPAEIWLHAVVSWWS